MQAGFLVSVVVLMLAVAAPSQQRSPAPSPAETRVEQEEFLTTASIVTGPPADGRRSWRASLDNGIRKHDASVETADGSDRTRRDYRFNVAAYVLDKLLDLHLVLPSVARSIGGRPVSLTWWVDDFVMSEVDRRRKVVEPPDLERWSRQVDAVRVFDELISNTYRDTSPGLYLNSVWDNLLITKDWTIWLVDHTSAFRTRTRLEDPGSLSRCPRTVLASLRKLDRIQLRQALDKYLSAEQLETLEVRRALLVRHFDELIATKGEVSVLYDLWPGR